MKLILLSILLGALHPGDLNESTFLNHTTLSGTDTTLFQADSINMIGDTTGLAYKAREKVKESGLYKQLGTPGKYRAFLFIICMIGGILALRFSARFLRFTDNLLLRVQHRPNTFDGYQFTGNPFILKGPFYALYHLFLGRNAYRSYLVWPLKYILAISFIAAMLIRGFPDEAFHSIQDFQALLLSSLSARIAFGLVFLLYLVIVVLVSIESFRKTKWLFPLRLLVYLVLAIVIFIPMHKLFWLIVAIDILYLLTHLGRDFIARQRIAAAGGYPVNDLIYEPWPDGSTKVYSG